MFEEFDREQAGSPYFGYDHAQAAKLMFDGSVNGYASGDARPSVSPQDYIGARVPRNLAEWRQNYVPLDTFPVPLSGLGEETELSQRWRWTLFGLGGFDYPVRSWRPGGAAAGRRGR